MEQHEMHHEHQQETMYEPQHTDHRKFSLSFAGIDWKKECMNAVEIFRLNKTKMHEVSKDSKATTAGLVFILVPQILSLLIAIIFSKGFYGFMHGTYILGGIANFGFVSIYNIGIILPFIFIWGTHFCATTFFQGKGDMIAYFRVVSYIFSASIICTVLTLLMSIFGNGSDIFLSLANLITWVIIIMAVVVSYFWMIEGYHMNTQNAVLAPVISIVVAGVIVWILNRMLFPNPINEWTNQLNRALKDLK